MTGRPHHLLYITDDEREAALFEEALAQCVADFPQAVTFQVERPGEAALATIERQRPDLVFLDLHVGRRESAVSSWDVLAALKSATRTPTPVIVLASADVGEDRHRALSLQANGFVVKDVRFDEFTAQLRSALSFWLSRHVHLPRW